MSSVKEKVVQYMHDRGWSIVETAKRAGLPLVTIKSIVYGKSSGHKTNTLDKLAKAFDCTIDNLVSDDVGEEGNNEILDKDLWKECLDAVDSYCVRKNVKCEKNKMMKVVESLVSLYGKKKAKKVSYIIDDDTIEWIIGNIK